MIETIRFNRPLPYHAQIASRDLAWQIFELEQDPALDPNWAATGAETAEEYSYWVMRACGIACVKMCVEAFGGEQASLMEWIRRGLALNGYLVTEDEGKLVERGWVHSRLAQLLQSAGLEARAAAAGLDEIVVHLRAGGLLIASVSYELGTLHPVTFRGGHLVVVRGADLTENEVQTMYINNPSGRLPHLQENAAIPAERFLQAYTGRVVVVGRTA